MYKPVYFVAWYAVDGARAWDNDKHVFVPAWQRLYRSTWETIDAAEKVLRDVREMFPDMAADICLDSDMKWFDDPEPVKRCRRCGAEIVNGVNGCSLAGDVCFSCRPWNMRPVPVKRPEPSGDYESKILMMQEAYYED